MAWVALLLKAIVLLPAFLVLNNAVSLYRNYLAARKIGCRMQVIPMNPKDIIWGLFDNRILTHVRQLPFHLGDSHLTDWNVKDRRKFHQGTGSTWTLVTPSYNFIYLSDSDSDASTYTRHADMCKPAVTSR